MIPSLRMAFWGRGWDVKRINFSKHKQVSHNNVVWVSLDKTDNGMMTGRPLSPGHQLKAILNLKKAYSYTIYQQYHINAVEFIYGRSIPLAIPKVSLGRFFVDTIQYDELGALKTLEIRSITNELPLYSVLNKPNHIERETAE
jgi:hypothetical protein